MSVSNITSSAATVASATTNYPEWTVVHTRTFYDVRWRIATTAYMAGRIVFGIRMVTYLYHFAFFLCTMIRNKWTERTSFDDEDDIVYTTLDKKDSFREISSTTPVYGYPSILLIFTAFNKTVQSAVLFSWCWSKYVSGDKAIERDPERYVMIAVFVLLFVVVVQRLFSAAYVLYIAHNKQTRTYQVNLLVPLLLQLIFDQHVITESTRIAPNELRITPLVIELMKYDVITVNFTVLLVFVIALMFWVYPDKTVFQSVVSRWGGLYEQNFADPTAWLLVLGVATTLIQHLTFYSRVDTNWGPWKTDEDQEEEQLTNFLPWADTVTDLDRHASHSKHKNIEANWHRQFSPSSTQLTSVPSHSKHNNSLIKDLKGPSQFGAPVGRTGLGSISRNNRLETRLTQRNLDIPEEHMLEEEENALHFNENLAEFGCWDVFMILFRFLEVVGRVMELGWLYAFTRFIFGDVYALWIVFSIQVFSAFLLLGVEDRIRQSWSSKNVFIFGRTKFYWALSGYIVGDFFVGRHQLMAMLCWKILNSFLIWCAMFFSEMLDAKRGFMPVFGYVKEIWPFAATLLPLTIAIVSINWAMLVVITFQTTKPYQRYNLHEARRDLSQEKAHVVFKYFSSVHPHSMILRLKSTENATWRLLPFCARVHPRFFKFLVHVFSIPLQHVDFSGFSFAHRESKCFDFTGMDFSESVLNGTTFIGVDLRGCNFKNAEIRESYFYRVELSNSNFTNANIHGTLFHECVTKNVSHDAVQGDVRINTETIRKKKLFDIDEPEEKLLVPENQPVDLDFSTTLFTQRHDKAPNVTDFSDDWKLTGDSIQHDLWMKDRRQIKRRLNKTEYDLFWKVLTGRGTTHLNDVERAALTSSIDLLRYSTRKPPHLLFRIASSSVRAANDTFSDVKIIPKIVEWLMFLVMTATFVFFWARNLSAFQHHLTLGSGIAFICGTIVLGDNWTPTSFYAAIMFSFGLVSIVAQRFIQDTTALFSPGLVSNGLLVWMGLWVIWYVVPVNIFASFSSSMYHSQRYREQVEKTVMVEEELRRFLQIPLFQGQNRVWKRYLDVNPWSFSRFEVEPLLDVKLKYLIQMIITELQNNENTEVVPKSAEDLGENTPYKIFAKQKPRNGDPISTAIAEKRHEELQSMIRDFIVFAHADLKLVFRMKDNLQKILVFSWNLVELLFNVISIFVILIIFVKDKNAAINSIIPAMLTSFALGKNSFDSISKGISFVYFAHPFTAGDVVVYKKETYEVQSIELATTELRNTRTGLSSIVSNSDLESQLIENITITGAVAHLTEIYVVKKEFSYECDFHQAKEELAAAFLDVKDVKAPLESISYCDVVEIFFKHILLNTFPWNSFVSKVLFVIDYKPKSRPQGKPVQYGGNYIRLGAKAVVLMPHYQQPKRKQHEIMITGLLTKITNIIRKKVMKKSPKVISVMGSPSPKSVTRSTTLRSQRSPRSPRSPRLSESEIIKMHRLTTPPPQ